MKVMIVDNSLIILKTIESYINELTEIEEVILCSNSMQTLEIIRQKNIDIVILDVSLAEINGLEVLERIRQEAALNDVQVLMITSEPAYMTECMNLGSDGCINKPFDRSELQFRIKAAVKTRKSLMLVNEMNRKLSAKNKELQNLNQVLKDTQSNIIQKEKMASIGELAAGVAHEINNPLGFVKSNIETLSSFLRNAFEMINVYSEFCQLLSLEGKEEYRGYIQQISQAEERYKIKYITEEISPLFKDLHEGVLRVTKIVSTLTSFAHTGNEGEFVINNINSIIEEALLIIRNEYKYSIDVQTHLCEFDEVRCNKSQIEQVLINVIMNAIQAIRSQKREEMGHIYIYTERLDSAFRIRISDDGPGIPAPLINRIFDPFFTTKEIGQGTGLGLSISYDIIVNKHGGRINVSNMEPSGTGFAIDLPLCGLKDSGGEQGECL